ncbi:MAG: trigger factor [Planctomycetia bacterium]|nr:trigger factor [Planctomycetia bacterium]
MMSPEKNTPDAVVDETAEAEALQKMNLSIKVDSPSACQRHITVTIPREDVDRYYDKAFSELMESANVPGFRAGRAPRKLVEARFRKDVTGQVKGSLLMDSMAQITEEEKFSAISEPDFDPQAVEVPDEGPMTFEFDLEVRPEFDLPEWKGLSVERPVREFTKKDVDKRLEQILARHGRLVPFNGPAAVGDYISCNLTFKNGAVELSSSNEEVIRIRPVLSFRDGNVANFDKLMKGVRAGETREADAKLTADAPNESLRGQTITAVFEVLEVKKLELPELTPELLHELGDFESEGDLRDAIKEDLQRQLEYHQQQQARRQITAALTESANWQLPPQLLRRQSRRELERSVLELRRNGFSDTEIQAHENDLRQNSAAATARSLKEHFILERIAEDQDFEASPEDYQAEIALIAAQRGESARRVRARLEKGDMMDSLRNQIIERKVIDLVLSHAHFKDVPYKPEGTETEAIDQSAGGEEEESEIPEAKHPGEAEPLRTSKEHD